MKRPLFILVFISALVVIQFAAPAMIGTAESGPDFIPAADRPVMPQSLDAQLVGIVVELGTSTPIPGALVTVDGPGQSTKTDDRGHFFFWNLVSSEQSEIRATISVRTKDYAPWKIDERPLYLDNQVQLIVQLSRDRAYEGRYQTPDERRQAPITQTKLNSQPTPVWETFKPKDEATVKLLGLDLVGTAHAAGACNTYHSQEVPPGQIKVWRVAEGTVEWVNFAWYIKNVLPNEWVASWHQESLRSGAIAVKHYGWYWVNNDGKWGAQAPDGICAHVQDTISDQVYDPDNGTTAATNKATDYTYANIYKKNGTVFQSQFVAGQECEVPNDSAWHVYTYNNVGPMAGAHNALRFSLYNSDPNKHVQVDQAVLHCANLSCP